MSNPLHADFYADRAMQRRVTIVENMRLAKDTYRVRFECPEIARRIVPGQFLMIRLVGQDDPLLGRPLAVYDIVADSEGNPIGIDVVYLVVGKMTSRLADFQPGRLLDVWGPLGNGFPPSPTRHLIMVAGGIGQTPFLALAREYTGQQKYGEPRRIVQAAEKATFCYGARASEYLAGLDDFQRVPLELKISTDDGSRGHHGFVTDLLRQTLAETTIETCRVVCCGPERMMEAVAEIAQRAGARCDVSLETPMACGIGICFSCVTKVRQADGGWDYKRTCVEGPIFDAERIVW